MRIFLLGLAVCGQFTFATPISCLGTLATDWSRSADVRIESHLAPRTLGDLRDAILDTKLPLAVRGGGYSMGGQTMIANGRVIDMRHLNQILNYDPAKKTIHVQTGATWAQIQDFIRKDGLAVKVMQSYNNFQVGGALSVNAHGRYVGYGPIISTVKSIRVMLANGDLVYADRENTSDLFYGAIGGYGALGIITDAELELTDDVHLEREVRDFSVGNTLEAKVADALTAFDREVAGRADSVMWNVHIFPPRYQTLQAITYRKTDKPRTILDPMQRVSGNPLLQFGQAALISLEQSSALVKILREKAYSSWSGGPQVASTNWQASYDVRDLYSLSDRYPWLREYIPTFDRKALLQEYFIPRTQVPQFVAKMRDIFLRHHVNVSNVSLRHVPQNRESVMSWSREESIAVVIFYTQDYGPNKQANLDKAALWTREMIDEVLSKGGTYYLPYQLYPTREQFLGGYPRYTDLMELKRKYDPHGRFTNSLWQNVGP